MPLLKIRYRPGILILLISMALLLLFLSIYTSSIYRMILAVIWLVISLNNIMGNSVLDVTNEHIVIRNGLGLVTKRYLYKEGEIEFRNKSIFFNKKKIYTHSFSFSEDDFEKVREYLVERNPELNLGRHLVPDEDRD